MSHVSKQQIAHVARFEKNVGARRTFRNVLARVAHFEMCAIEMLARVAHFEMCAILVPKLRTLCIAKKSQGYTARTKS